MSELPQIILLVCSALTIITVVPLILIFLLKKQSRTYGFRLVFLLFVFDFLYSAVSLISMIYILIEPNVIIYPPLCKLQGALREFVVIGSYFTTITISWSLYTQIIRGKPIKTKNPIEYFAIFNVLLPLFFSIIPLILDRYDRVEPFSQVLCTFCLREENGQTDYIGISLRFGIYYIPFAVSLIFDMFVVIRIIHYFYKNKNEDYRTYQIKTILLYPVALFLSWIFVIFQRVFEIFSKENYQWLSYVDLPFATLNGFFNAMIYGFFSLNAHKYICEEISDQNQSNKISLLKESEISNTFDINSN